MLSNLLQSTGDEINRIRAMAMQARLENMQEKSDALFRAFLETRRKYTEALIMFYGKDAAKMILRYDDQPVAIRSMAYAFGTAERAYHNNQADIRRQLRNQQ